MEVILWTVVGMLLGACTAWLIARQAMLTSVSSVRATAEVERIALAEKIRESDARASEIQRHLEEARHEVLAGTETLRKESIARAAAEEAARRIPSLENALREKEEGHARLVEERTVLSAELSALRVSLEEERRSSTEKLGLIEDAQSRFSDAFSSLSAEALKSNNQAFLDLAKERLEKLQQGAQGDLNARQQAIDTLVKPLVESLTRVDQKIQDLEIARVGAYEGLNAQVAALLNTQVMLRTETGNLVKALRSPVVRGRWGEVQLRRCVELAGMMEHVDFLQQESADGDSGKLRPDMLVRLPAGKNVIVDSKAPVNHYLDAIAEQDEDVRNAKFRDYARLVRDHVTKLTRKSYWEQFQPTPEFVVMFLPGETFFSAALEHDPSLIEFGAEQRVVIATPTTLIALLRAVSYGWQQESLAENAEQICALGRELHKRIADLAGHWQLLGKRLEGAVQAYNGAVGTLESRVLVSARRFQELGAASPAAEIEVVTPVEQAARLIQAIEMQPNG